MGRVVVVGYLSIDALSTPAGRFADMPGGAALYAALGARARGAAVALLAAAGEDWPERWLAEAARLGIDVSGVERRAGPTRRARLAHAADGTRRSDHHAEAAWWERTAALLPPLPPRLRSGDALVLGPMPAEHARRVLDAAGPCRAVADTSEAFAAREPAALRALLPRLAAFAPSREELRHLGTVEGCAVVEKRGPEGLALRDPPTVIAPPPVRAVDPTGAGDAAVGALAAGLAAGESLADAARAAVAVGARAVTGVGPAALGFAA